MTEKMQVRVPDLGDADAVEVIELLVKTGDTVAIDDPLITLESDKASMDVPTPVAGVVLSLDVAVGDTISAGSVIATLAYESSNTEASSKISEDDSNRRDNIPLPTQGVTEPGNHDRADVHADVVVIGSGPGGYSAAFRAADLGKRVVLVERYPDLGGVCLNVGCIPSKALLHAAKVISDAREMADHGIRFGTPDVDLTKLHDWKNSVVGTLTGGLVGLAKRRKVDVVQGYARFDSSRSITVSQDEETKTISFDSAIIAVGSSPITLPFIPHDDPRVIDSTGALALAELPQRMLILGGGIIGLEMATVYHELGVRVSIVEMMDRLMAGADADIVKPLATRANKFYENVWLSTRVTNVEADTDGLIVSMEGEDAPTREVFDCVLVAVGRRANGAMIDADRAGLNVDKHGFIPVDDQQRTNVPHIFAIGDVVGQPMLAHKATHEGHVAAEVAAGEKSGFDNRVIPSVAYTDPEVAWVGITEEEAASKNIPFEKGVFPWAASGRSLSIGRNEGMTKLLFDPDTHRIIGAGIVGTNAGDLIGEVAHAIEMGSDASDIGLTIHAHPTLSETVGLAAEVYEGTITDLYVPKRKKQSP